MVSMEKTRLTAESKIGMRATSINPVESGKHGLSDVTRIVADAHIGMRIETIGEEDRSSKN